MSEKTLEERVAALELRMAELKPDDTESIRAKNIKLLAAMAAFPPDTGLSEIMELALQLRDEDRRQAYEKFDRGELPIP